MVTDTALAQQHLALLAHKGQTALCACMLRLGAVGHTQQGAGSRGPVIVALAHQHTHDMAPALVQCTVVVTQ
jgi:hypothetical protein